VVNIAQTTTKTGKNIMKLPKQTQPVMRTIGTDKISSAGVEASVIYNIDTDARTTRNCNIACAYCSQCGG
jgi:sulfatase maturation enzyme AslB (radical SAM superfamily)